MMSLRRAALAALLPMLAAAAGCDAASDPGPGPRPPGVWFEEVATERGLVFEHRSGHRGEHYMPEIMGGGAALFDMDGDGDLDVYLVQSGSLVEPDARETNRLFRNGGDGRFDDVTEGSGAGDAGYGMGVAAADYDGDGDVDLYVTNVGPDRLLRNEGGGRFTDRTAASGLGHAGWSTSAAFFDYDRDGDLDLFVANYVEWSKATENDCYSTVGTKTYCGPRTYRAPARDVLYRNEGDGTFADVTVAMGLDAAFGNGLGVVAADFSGDGWLDVFVANDGTLNQLWINDAGRAFHDEALLRGCAADQDGLAKAGMGVSVKDLDGDGDLDLLVGNLYDESDSLFVNEGRYFFDATATAGLAFASRRFTRFGLGWVDFDNDGVLDLYEANGRVKYQSELYVDDVYAEPNLLFHGVGHGRFEELLPRGGTATPLVATSRAAAFGDLDGDGAVDVVVVNRDAPAHLLRNVAPRRGHWLLLSVLDAAGAPAEGAVLTLSAGPRTLRRDVRAASSYLASNDPRVHVGLGPIDGVDDVRVRWVDGAEERFGPFGVDRVVRLRRGEGREVRAPR